MARLNLLFFFFISDHLLYINKMIFLRRKLFLLLFGSLASFVLVCYFVYERETAVSGRRVVEMPLDTIQSKDKGKSN